MLLSMKNKISLLLLVLLMAPGCAYFQRKSCESKNWFEYAKSIAMKGQRLSGDHEIQSCRKVEANINEAQIDQGWKAGQALYCSPVGANEIGRQGQVFFGEICDSNMQKLLREENLKGIRIYCAPEKGYELGNTGATYANVCPEDMAKAHLESYNKGRKSFLSKKVEQLKAENNKKEKDLRYEEGLLAGKQSQVRYAEGRLSGIPLERALERHSATDEVEKLKSDLRQTEWRVQSLKNDISRNEKEIDRIERELNGL